MVSGADSWTLINPLLVLQFLPELATAIGYRVAQGSHFNLFFREGQEMIAVSSSLYVAYFLV